MKHHFSAALINFCLYEFALSVLILYSCGSSQTVLYGIQCDYDKNKIVLCKYMLYIIERNCEK